MTRKSRASPTGKSAKNDDHNPRSSGDDEVKMGQRIRLRRVEMGMSQQELGTKLGVSFQQVQKYEKGANRVGASRLQQIANELGVPVSFFFGAGTIKQNEVESLLFLDSNFTLRLLRAYAAVGDQKVQRQFVLLMESMAGTIVEE